MSRQHSGRRKSSAAEMWVKSLEGEKFDLLARFPNLVLEFGCLSSPDFWRNSKEMDHLSVQVSWYQFAVLYGEETNPGVWLPRDCSSDEARHRARRMQSRLSQARRVYLPIDWEPVVDQDEPGFGESDQVMIFTKGVLQKTYSDYDAATVHQYLIGLEPDESHSKPSQVFTTVRSLAASGPDAYWRFLRKRGFKKKPPKQAPHRYEVE